MKTLYLFLAVILSAYLCTDDNEDNIEDPVIYLEPENPISACGIDDPLNELEWLHYLITDSLDNSSWFVESVWIKQHDQKDLFFITISPSSVMFYVRDCQGEFIIIDMEVYNSLTEKDLIYTIIPENLR